VRLEVVRGPEALRATGAQFDELLAAIGAPVTTRRPWLQAWVDSYPMYEPVMFALYGPTGGLEAAAPLAVRRRLGTRTVTALGHGPSDAAMLPGRANLVARLEASRIGRPGGGETLSATDQGPPRAGGGFTAVACGQPPRTCLEYVRVVATYTRGATPVAANAERRIASSHSACHYPRRNPEVNA
jgi:hypothetical protein